MAVLLLLPPPPLLAASPLPQLLQRFQQSWQCCCCCRRRHCLQLHRFRRPLLPLLLRMSLRRRERQTCSTARPAPRHERRAHVPLWPPARCGWHRSERTAATIDWRVWPAATLACASEAPCWQTSAPASPPESTIP